MVILSNENGNEVGFADFFERIDIDVNDKKDFEAMVGVSDLEKYSTMIRNDFRIFVPGTEYGGIIKGIRTSTSDETVTFTGKTWRGYLESKIIEPPAGTAYKIVSGDVNSVTQSLLEETGLEGLFRTTENVGTVVENYQFDRYITLLEGLEKLYATCGTRLNIEYVQGEQGAPGYVELKESPVEDLSEVVELSQDSEINFVFSKPTNNINHLICLGSGELTERLVVHLYIQKDGSVGLQKYYTGTNEFVGIYENVNISSESEMIKEGEERLIKLYEEGTSFDASIGNLGFEVAIGNFIGGRDHITGLTLKKAIKNKIYKENDGVVSIEYRLEE